MNIDQYINLSNQQKEQRVISFDFDDTLALNEYHDADSSRIDIMTDDDGWPIQTPNWKVLVRMNTIHENDKCIIITSRYEDTGSEQIYKFWEKHLKNRIAKEDIHFTNHDWKANYIHANALDVDVHYDDYQEELTRLERSGIETIHVRPNGEPED